MPAAHVLGRRSRRPNGGQTLQVDRSSPLAAGLKYVWTWAQGSVAGFPVAIRLFGNGAGFAHVPGQYGHGGEGGQDNMYQATTDNSSPSGWGPVTLTYLAELSTATTRGTCVTWSNGGDEGISLGVGSGDFDADGNNLVALHGGVAWKGSGQAIGLGTHVCSYALTPGGTHVFYIDGKQVATTTGTPTSGPGKVTIAGQTTSGNRIAQAGIRLKAVMVHARALSQQEQAMLGADFFSWAEFR